MQKTSLTLAALLVTAMSAPTMAAEWFVGGGMGAQQNTYKGSNTYEAIRPVPVDNQLVDPNTSWEEDGGTDEIYEFRAGAYLNDENRIYGTYSYNSDDGTEQQSLLLSYDYLVHIGESQKFNWFIGATVGSNHVAPRGDDFGSSDNFVWGGQTGFMYRITDSLSTEIGYRYLVQDADVSDTDTHHTENGLAYEHTGTISLDNSQQVYLAVDYRF